MSQDSSQFATGKKRDVFLIEIEVEAGMSEGGLGGVEPVMFLYTVCINTSTFLAGEMACFLLSIYSSIVLIQSLRYLYRLLSYVNSIHLLSEL